MDAQTPVSVFSKVRDLSGSAYLFESVVGGERWARYSMIGLGSDLILQYADGNMTIKKTIILISTRLMSRSTTFVS